MENTIVSLKLRNFLTDETPEDVVQIDLLYKESNSPTVYIVDKIKFFGTESVKVAEQNLNYWNVDLQEPYYSYVEASKKKEELEKN